MKIAVCGSITFYDQMKKISKELKSLGFEKIYMPVRFGSGKHQWKEDLTAEESGDRKIALDLIKKHYYKILSADCILVVNLPKKGLEGYIGGNTFLEMGFAFVLGKPIFLMNSIPEISYEAEIKGMKPILINNNLQKVKDYYHL